VLEKLVHFEKRKEKGSDRGKGAEEL
jgi:hypothetical protein